MPAGGDALEIWADDPVFAEGWQEGNWTLNGIAWNGDDLIYVSRTDIDGFYQVSIESDGSAGAIQQIIVEDTNVGMGYDGITALDSDTILVTEYGTGRFIMVDITGNSGTKLVPSQHNFDMLSFCGKLKANFPFQEESNAQKSLHR